VRFKLDENLDPRLAPLVQEGGHDVETVHSERLSGSSDNVVYDVCLREARTLVTLDLDFSNPFRFPPAPAAGIIVVRPPHPTFSQIRATLAAALPTLKRQSLHGKLWIVEPGRIRLHDPEEDVL
jgi:predicted nuclease of predicted toxin-antitoxin system